MHFLLALFLKDTKVIRSQKPPHNILQEACTPCRRGDAVAHVSTVRVLPRKAE